MDCIKHSQLYGRVRAFTVPWEGASTSLWKPCGPLVPNAVLYDWAPILIGNLRNEPDGKSYHIGGMYLEFDNSGGAITNPSITRDESLGYYANLNSNNPNRDYLRVALIASEAENTDASKYSAENLGRFYAHTSGVTGVHGLDFADTANSVVYGGALVAYREFGDASQDLVFSRFYFEQAQHTPKVASSQIGIAWEITGQ